MVASDAFRRVQPLVIGSVIPAYCAVGPVAFAYAQGSLVEGLADDADLDLVVVWDEEPPPSEARLPLSIAAARPGPVSFDEPHFRLDRFFIDGQQVDTKHVSLDEVEGWRAQVERGGGTSGYPMPAIALHGLTSGVLLFDVGGVGAAHRLAAETVPEAYRTAVQARARASLDDFVEELDRCAHREDGMLFHDQLVALARMLFIAWFAQGGRWWPHEKRLGERLRRVGEARLAAIESDLWRGTLFDRTEAVRQLASEVLDEGRRR